MRLVIWRAFQRGKSRMEMDAESDAWEDLTGFEDDLDLAVWNHGLGAQDIRIDVDAPSTVVHESGDDGACLFYSVNRSNNLDDAMKLREAVAFMTSAHLDTNVGADNDGPPLRVWLQACTAQDSKKPYDVMADVERLTKRETWGSSALYYQLATVKNRPLWVVASQEVDPTAPTTKRVKTYLPLEQLEHSIFHLDGCQDCTPGPNPIIVWHNTNHYDAILECVLKMPDGSLQQYHHERGILPCPVTPTVKNDSALPVSEATLPQAAAVPVTDMESLPVDHGQTNGVVAVENGADGHGPATAGSAVENDEEAAKATGGAVPPLQTAPEHRNGGVRGLRLRPEGQLATQLAEAWGGVWPVRPATVGSSSWFRQHCANEVDPVGRTRLKPPVRLFQDQPWADGPSLSKYGCVEVGEYLYVSSAKAVLSPGTSCVCMLHLMVKTSKHAQVP